MAIPEEPRTDQQRVTIPRFDQTPAPEELPSIEEAAEAGKIAREKLPTLPEFVLEETMPGQSGTRRAVTPRTPKSLAEETAAEAAKATDATTKQAG